MSLMEVGGKAKKKKGILGRNEKQTKQRCSPLQRLNVCIYVYVLIAWFLCFAILFNPKQKFISKIKVCLYSCIFFSKHKRFLIGRETMKT